LISPSCHLEGFSRMRHRTHPQSPVQSVRNPSLLPFLLFAIAFAGYIGWDNREQLADWIDGAAPDPAKGPRRARAELYRLFSTDDYPMEALRREEQGTVAFRLSIGRRGNVTDCVVTSSSGSAVLDDATCDILESRAKYEPARDAEGKRISDEDTGRIRWVLPED
jgi:TonB family protein